MSWQKSNKVGRQYWRHLDRNHKKMKQWLNCGSHRPFGSLCLEIVWRGQKNRAIQGIYGFLVWNSFKKCTSSFHFFLSKAKKNKAISCTKVQERSLLNVIFEDGWELSDSEGWQTWPVYLGARNRASLYNKHRGLVCVFTFQMIWCVSPPPLHWDLLFLSKKSGEIMFQNPLPIRLGCVPQRT